MEIPRHWRLKQQRYSLTGKVCPHCEHKIFPPRGICPNCGGDLNQAAVRSPKIESYTTVYQPAAKESPIAALIKEPVAA